ncbi:MAG: metallophosphoesterase [Planctomycetota bacterium]|nr:metallophosphoesterase [Planctomycetota bacterium]
MTTSSLAAVFVSVALDAAIAYAILLRGNDRTIDLPRVLRAAGAILAVGALKCALGLYVAHSYFLVVALVYADLMVLVPMVGLAVLLAARTRSVTRSARVLAGAGLGMIPIFVIATFVEPYRLVTEKHDVEITSKRALPRPLVIGVLADVQCVEVTDRERDAVARVMAAQPDLIVLPGDLQQAGFDHADEIGPALRELFAPLAAPLGVYYVEGNTESVGEARKLLAGSNVRILDEEIVHLERDGARITLCGVGLTRQSPRSRAALREIQGASGDDDVRIVLAHQPDVVYDLETRTRVDLVIAGHTHGGQVRLPWFGPPITLSSVPRAVAAGGLHEVDGRRIYVSRGIGWEHGHAPRVRFLCPPEVSLLTLRSAARN